MYVMYHSILSAVNIQGKTVDINQNQAQNYLISISASLLNDD